MIEEDLARLRAYIEQVAESGGERLPPEPRLSEELGISRGRLRTLLKRMEDQGEIWRHVGKGTFLGQRHLDLDHLLDPSNSVSADDIMDTRMLIEPQIAAQAAIRSTPADIQAMDQCLGEMQSRQSFTQWKRLDEKLHRTIAASTHNALLLMMYDTLRRPKLSLDSRLEEVFGLAGPKSKTEDQHNAIVDAIRAHDPMRAEAAMRDHLSSVRRALFGLR